MKGIAATAPDRLDPGQRGQSCDHTLEVGPARRRIRMAIPRENLQRRDPLLLEAGIHAQQVDEAAEQQPASGHEDERQRDLHGDQPRSQPPVRAACGGRS